jgi:hypothetical protein
MRASFVVRLRLLWLLRLTFLPAAAKCEPQSTINTEHGALHTFLSFPDGFHCDLTLCQSAEAMKREENLTVRSWVWGGILCTGLTTPLQDLRGEVETVRVAVDKEYTDLKEKLDQRASVRERKATLQRFLQIASSVDKIEMLLGLGGLGGGSESENGGSGDGGSNGGGGASRSGTNNAGDDGEADGSGGKLIERVASEFNQLQFHAEQCSSRSPFLDKISPRIKTITETLERQLEKSFRRGLVGHQEPPPPWLNARQSQIL